MVVLGQISIHIISYRKLLRQWYILDIKKSLGVGEEHSEYPLPLPHLPHPRKESTYRKINFWLEKGFIKFTKNKYPKRAV